MKHNSLRIQIRKCYDKGEKISNIKCQQNLIGINCASVALRFEISGYGLILRDHSALET